MSISEMTFMSHFFMMTAVVSGIVTVAMYFVLDIRRCLKIVRGGHIAVSREAAHAAVISEAKPDGSSEKTERLAAQETEVLLDETMTLIQDIVLIEVGNGVNP